MFRSLSHFESQVHINTDIRRPTHLHTDTGDYPKVPFCKNAPKKLTKSSE